MSSHPGFHLEKVIDSVCGGRESLEEFLYEKRTLRQQRKNSKKLLTCLKMFGILYKRVREKRAPREKPTHVFDTLFAE